MEWQPRNEFERHKTYGTSNSLFLAISKMDLLFQIGIYFLGGNKSKANI